MSQILYYSNFCSNCKEILPQLAQSSTKSDIHFICIDNRIKKNDGSTYIILSNQQEIILPQTVNKVPALLLLNRGNQILYGNNILEYLQPKKTGTEAKLENTEPDAFSFNDMNSSGVVSDNFSFLDQSIEALSAKGDGGLRQLRNNAKLEFLDNIETPPDDYTPNKIGNISMDEIQTNRANAIKK
jgi:hypothetical protein